MTTKKLIDACNLGDERYLRIDKDGEHSGQYSVWLCEVDPYDADPVLCSANGGLDTCLRQIVAWVKKQ
jgi:hypothetical protein